MTQATAPCVTLAVSRASVSLANGSSWPTGTPGRRRTERPANLEATVFSEEQRVLSEERTVFSSWKRVFSSWKRVFSSWKTVFSSWKRVFTSWKTVFSEGPTVFSSWKAVFSEGPTVFSEEPTVFSEEPTVFSEEPTVFSSWKAVFSEEPAVFSSWKTVFSSWKTVFTTWKRVFSEEPTVFSEEPTVFSEEPTVFSEVQAQTGVSVPSAIPSASNSSGSGGYRLLRRYGRYIHVDERRLKLGIHLFCRYGGKIVFFGRFVAVVRACVAFLAGANCMPYRRFFAANAASAVVWAAAVGVPAYLCGERAARIGRVLGHGLLALAAARLIAATLFMRRHEKRLEDEAERAMPGPLPGGPRRDAAPRHR